MPRPSDLAQCMGEDDIALLAATFGAGQRLFVPSSTANAAHLELILGLPATSQLVHAFGGNYLYLPGLPRTDGRKRDPSLALVKALSRPGPKRMSAAAIARQFRVSVRTIYHKRAEIRRRERMGIALEAANCRKTHNRKNARDRKLVKRQKRHRQRQGVNQERGEQ